MTPRRPTLIVVLIIVGALFLCVVFLGALVVAAGAGFATFFLSA
jgi:hypothetical protein